MNDSVVESIYRKVKVNDIPLLEKECEAITE